MKQNTDTATVELGEETVELPTTIDRDDVDVRRGDVPETIRVDMIHSRHAGQVYLVQYHDDGTVTEVTIPRTEQNAKANGVEVGEMFGVRAESKVDVDDDIMWTRQ